MTIEHMVTSWISVHHDDSSRGGWACSSGTLYHKRQSMAHAPHPGDEISLWPDEDGDPDGCQVQVVRRWWDCTGRLNLKMLGFQVNPDDTIQQYMLAQLAMARSWRASWWSDRDGDLEANLASGDWFKYSPRMVDR